MLGFKFKTLHLFLLEDKIMAIKLFNKKRLSILFSQFSLYENDCYPLNFMKYIIFVSVIKILKTNITYFFNFINKMSLYTLKIFFFTYYIFLEIINLMIILLFVL
jgi:hypothetical protein